MPMYSGAVLVRLSQQPVRPDGQPLQPQARGRRFVGRGRCTGSAQGISIRYRLRPRRECPVSQTLGQQSKLVLNISVPASYNGLFGFRSSWHRSPYGGSTNSQLGQEAVPSILGPHSPSAQGLTLFFKSVLEGEPWLIDPMAPRMPWNQALYQLAEHGEGKEPLCFGFQWDNGDVKPNPPYYRAMEMVKAALTRAGHKGECRCGTHRTLEGVLSLVIDWTFPDTVKQQELLVSRSE